MALAEDETRKQTAAGSDDQGMSFRTSFDPFNLIMQQLGRLDTKMDDQRKELDAKLNGFHKELYAKLDGLHKEVDTKLNGFHKELYTKLDGLHQELHNTTRWIIGTVITVAGVAIGLASWLYR